MKKLKPCPFCGGKARMIEPEPQGYCVECTKCTASSVLRFALMDDCRDDVAESWNRRKKRFTPEDVEAARREGYEAGWNDRIAHEAEERPGRERDVAETAVAKAVAEERARILGVLEAATSNFPKGAPASYVVGRCVDAVRHGAKQATPIRQRAATPEKEKP